MIVVDTWAIYLVVGTVGILLAACAACAVVAASLISAENRRTRDLEAAADEAATLLEMEQQWPAM